MLCLRIINRLKVGFAVLLLATMALLNYSLYHSSGQPLTINPLSEINSTSQPVPSSLSTHSLQPNKSVGYQLTTLYNESSTHQTGTSVQFKEKLITGVHPYRVVLPPRSALNDNHTVEEEYTATEHHSIVESPATDSHKIDSSQAVKMKAPSMAPGINTSSRGYVVVLKVYEQQTMASGNLLQLQCWAQYLRLAVVKPFMYDSCLRTPLDESKHRIMLKLEDTFDMQDWSYHAASMGYSPLVEWSDFIDRAPRNVILVQLKYPVLTSVRAIRAQGRPFPRPPQEEYYRTGCKFRFIGSTSGQFLKSKGFKIVRQVCLNFNQGDELSLSQFQEEILGGLDPGDVSLIIDEWRGLGENQRVLIKEDICRENSPYREDTKPSQRLIRDAESYINTFLNGEDYLAVITRFEMTGLTRRVYGASTDAHAIIPYCLRLTLQTVKQTTKQLNLNKTFLSIDIGKYGSASFAQKKYYGHLQDMTQFVSNFHNGEMDLAKWESTFEQVSSCPDKGYIAMLQQSVVTRAKCILFVGGGSFQRRALNLYRELHPNPSEQCITVVNKCTSPSRPIQ